MNKKIITVILMVFMLLSLGACSGSEGGNSNSGGNDVKPDDRIPSGIWVIRYYGDEKGNYVEDLNMTTDYYGRPINSIEQEILNYSQMEYFVLDENGEGTYTDDFDNTQKASFKDGKVRYEDGYETDYVRNGDFLWYKKQYQEYYSVMENVPEELFEKIRNGAFACVEYDKAKVGDFITFGTYEIWPYNEIEECLKWKVLDKDGDRLLILSEKLIDAFSYNYNPDMVNLNDVTWENSSIRAFLNDPQGFLSRFSSEELAMIETTHLENKAANKELMKYWGDFVDLGRATYSDLAVQDLEDEKDTDDKVFLLSFQEVEKYFGEAEGPYEGDSDYPYNAMPANPNWVAYITEAYDHQNPVGYYEHDSFAGAWMTRTLSTDHHDEKMVTYITSNGQVFNYFTYTPMFIRPAMWIKIK